MILLLDIGKHEHARGTRHRKARPQAYEYSHGGTAARQSRQSYRGVCGCAKDRRSGSRQRRSARNPPGYFPVAAALAHRTLVLNAQTVTRIGVVYPNPASIGPDRLANAVAAKEHFARAFVVVDFGTAVTFDTLTEPAITLAASSRRDWPL